MIVGCLYLKTKGQSWLVDHIDRSLMKIDQLGRLTKKEPEKKVFNRFLPIATALEISAKTSKKKFGKLLDKLSAFHY